MRYRFETITLDTSRRELRRDDQVVAIEPRVFDLLRYLVEHPDRVIGREELVETVWSGRVISDASVASCVRSARRAIGDSGRSSRFIRTVQRRGFRFVVPVETEDEDSPSRRRAAERGSTGTTIRGASGGADSVGAPRPSEAPDTEASAFADLDLSLPPHGSLAVLSISVLAGDEGRAPLARAIADDIAFGLARTRWLFVSARASAARFDHAAFDPREIGRRLGVRYLLGGSIAFSGGRFRYTATLVDAPEGVEIWAERFERALGDLFEVQDEIAEMVIAGVESQIELRERRRAVLQPMRTPDAWEAYHRAIELLNRYAPTLHPEAEALLARAVKLDPASSRIVAALSFLHWQRAHLDDDRDRDSELARATETAWRSIALDPFDPAGHNALGRAALFAGRSDEAVDAFGEAVTLNPSFANAHYYLGFGHVMHRRLDETLGAVARARRISPYDPLSFAFMLLRAGAHAQGGEDDEALAWTRRALRQPTVTHHGRFVAAGLLALCERRDEAREQIALVRREHPRYSIAEHLRAIPQPPGFRERFVGRLREIGVD